MNGLYFVMEVSMGKARQPSRADRFWSRFILEKDHLRHLIFDGDLSSAHERLGELLEDASFPGVHELTLDESSAWMVLSPESNREVAKVVDEFVAAAPSMDGWKLFNRRQRKDIDDAIVFLEHVYEVEARDMMFSLEPAGDQFHVTMHTQLDEILGDTEKEGFVTFFLEHALGEDVSMRMIKNVRVGPIAGVSSDYSASGTLMDAREFVSTILTAAGR